MPEKAEKAEHMKVDPLDTLLTPETEKQFFTGQILPPLLKGESIAAVLLPNLGKRARMRYLLENSEKLGFGKLGKHALFYIDKGELTEESPGGYFSLIEHYLNQKFPDLHPGKGSPHTSFIELKDDISTVISQGYHLVFMLANFDSLTFPKTFFNNLKSLCDVETKYVHFIFLFINDIADTGKYDQLRATIVQNTFYVPLLSPKDQLHTLERLCRKYDYSLSRKQKELVIKLSGGLPGLTKSLCRIVSQSKKTTGEEIAEIALENQEVIVILEDAWNCLDENCQNTLRLIAQGNHRLSGPLPNRLAKQQIVTQEAGSHKIFSPLFAQFILKQYHKPQQLSVDPASGQILLDNIPTAERFTLQEYHLLIKLLSSPGKVFSRDEISEALWGKDSFEKYSDWAIDQIVSQARKKIVNLGLPPTTLQTIRGRGYRWLTPE
jgi:DNA-binding winged helix-turn-helix (wHTH) protein